MLLMRLKNDTRTLHDHIERTVHLEAGVPSPGEYRQLLASFYGYYEPVERRLGEFDWDALGFGWNARRKAPLLERDLRDFGESSGTLRNLPRCRELPPLDSIPKALGCLYVLEGATLGGHVIVQRLQMSGRGRMLPTAFFSSYGENLVAMWQSFRTYLSNYVAASSDDDVIVEAACETFRTMDCWLSRRANCP